MDSIWKANEFNSLFNFCGGIQASATCGNQTLYLDSLGNMTEFKINALKFGESCTYAIVSNCGYPKILINETELDVVVAGVPTWKDIRENVPNFTFDQKLTRVLSEAKDKLKNGTFEYTFGKGSIVEPDETCGKNRTLIVTVSNIRPSNPVVKEYRMLQSAEGKTINDIGITVGSTSQPDSAVMMALSFVATICILITLF
jgi:hypothetical protein